MTKLDSLQNAALGERTLEPPPPSPAKPHGGASGVPEITIVGGGFSGTVAAIKLLATARGPLRIRIIETRTELGRGVAYSTREAAHLMNGPAKLFSLHPDRPEHFAQFLAKFGRVWGWRDPLAPDYANSFAPRWVYGDYVRQELERAQQRAADGVSLEHVVAAAHDVQRRDGRLHVVLADGRSLPTDHVVLALGVFTGQLDLPIDPELVRNGRYIADPWDLERFEALPRTGRVLLIGSGLTMLDALVTLERRGHRGSYIAVSRRGQFVHPRRDVPALRDFLGEQPLPRTVLALLHIGKKETPALQGRPDWQSLILAIRPHVPTLWEQANDTERARFLRHLRPIWEVAMHRASPPAASLLERGRSEGWFKSQPGRLQSLEALPDGSIRAHLIRRGANTPETLDFAVAVNCTGAQYSWERLRDQPLTRNLLQSGLVRPGPLGMGIDADTEAAVISRDGAAAPEISAIGPLLRGSRWESATIVELLRQAVTLADRLSARLPATQPRVA